MASQLPTSLNKLAVVRTEGQTYPVGTIVFGNQGIYELPDGTRKKIGTDVVVARIPQPTDRSREPFSVAPNFVG